MAGTNPTTHIELSDWEPVFTFPEAGTPSRPQPAQSGGSSIIRDSLQLARNWPLTYRVKTRSDQHVMPLTRSSYVIPGLSGRASLAITCSDSESIQVDGKTSSRTSGTQGFVRSRRHWRFEPQLAAE